MDKKLTTTEIKILKAARDDGPVEFSGNGMTNRTHNWLMSYGYLERNDGRLRITLEGVKALEAAK